MSERWFLALDGDNIGRRLEFHIVSDDIDGLEKFTSSFIRATDNLIQLVSRYPNIDFLLKGGDSLLIALEYEQISDVVSCVEQATRGTGFTFSGGYGPSLREAYLALKIAKASGKNMIIPLDATMESR
ncbi:mCpol domain-containing protein [Streptomyces sp. 4N509B]|uniref:mCpol domain-containing protein n=1 Tax=Streptomyces sp. 4N509B TaxID=3457413 RepID=UPI003FCF8C87